jgi:hypothetical protein
VGSDKVAEIQFLDVELFSRGGTCRSHGANDQRLRRLPNSNLDVGSSDHSGNAGGGGGDLWNVGANDIFGVCVPILVERDEVESPGGIQGDAFFLPNVAQALKSSRVTNAGKGRDVECRLDQVFSIALMRY